MKVFRRWKLYKIGWFQYLSMWLRPTEKWTDEFGTHYVQNYKGVTYREDLK